MRTKLLRVLVCVGALIALTFVGVGVASADPGIGIGGAAGASASMSTPAAGRMYASHLRIGYKSAYGRSLYQIERQLGYAPAQARYLAQRIVNRIYPGSWWAHGTRSYTRGIYVPLYDRVFYYR